MPILNKSEFSPLTTYMAQKGGASAHKFHKALGNLHFPGTGALTDALTHGRTPGRGQHQWNILLQTSLNLPCEPRVGKHRLLKAPALGKEWEIESQGKLFSSTLHSITPNSSPKWSTQSQRQQKEPSLLPTWEQQRGHIAVHGTPCLKPLHGNADTQTAATTPLGASWHTKPCWQSRLTASRGMKNTISLIRICINHKGTTSRGW